MRSGTAQAGVRAWCGTAHTIMRVCVAAAWLLCASHKAAACLMTHCSVLHTLASRCNQGEAQAAMAHVQRLLAAGLAPADVGIITPYSAQVWCHGSATLPEGQHACQP